VGSVGVEDISGMGQQQWGQFAKMIAVVDMSHQSSELLQPTDCDRIFLRANQVGLSPCAKPHGLSTQGVHSRELQDRAAGVDFWDRANMGKQLKAQQANAKGKDVNNTMSQAEFINGLVRLAHRRFREEPSFYLRFRRLLDEHVRPNSGFMRVMDDDVSKALEGDAELKRVLSDAAPALRKIFKKYSQGDSRDREARQHQGTMNMYEYMSLLGDAALMGEDLTQREARQIFAQVLTRSTVVQYMPPV
jgi:hypothetical protein